MGNFLKKVIGLKKVINKNVKINLHFKINYMKNARHRQPKKNKNTYQTLLKTEFITVFIDPKCLISRYIGKIESREEKHQPAQPLPFEQE